MSLRNIGFLGIEKSKAGFLLTPTEPTAFTRHLLIIFLKIIFVVIGQSASIPYLPTTLRGLWRRILTKKTNPVRTFSNHSGDRTTGWRGRPFFTSGFTFPGLPVCFWRKTYAIRLKPRCSYQLVIVLHRVYKGFKPIVTICSFKSNML